MTLSTLWLFIAMTFVVSATPGPNMLLIMSVSARHGVRASVVAMLGCMTALLAMMSISAAGMGAVLQSSPQVFEALRLAGAAYLAYLGIKVWRAPVHDASTAPAVDGVTQASVPALKTGAIFREAFLVAASNPKAILFAAAFFPQFIHADSPQVPQFAILLATFTVIEVTWYFVYAVSGQRLSAYLQRAAVMKMFNRITGGVFVGFAALMATAKS
ncbi:MAG: amino acid transporter [Burkholderiales bacterium PBB3]|nr:MAG: amino acid transporter [Burkholderiales bacterium PBB3]